MKFATCHTCGMHVEDTPRGWHTHECNLVGLAVNATRKAVRGFTGKVRPGGIGNQRVMKSELECALIELHTDLARWNEFAEWDACTT